MKYIILSLLVLFSVSVYGQVEDTPLFVGKYFGNQSGGGAGYWQVTGNFTDESGYYDAASIQVGDVLFFVDAGIGYHLPVTSIISASGSSFTIRVNNTGISGVAGVPNGSGGIYRPNAPRGIWPYTAGLTASDQQTLNSYLIKQINGSSGATLTAPTLSLTALTSTEVQVSFSTISGADSYVIERSTSGAFSSAVFVAETKNTKYVNTGLAPGTTYYFRARAKGVGYGESANSSIVSATTLAGFSPDTVAGQVLFWDVTDNTKVTTSGGYIDQIDDKGSGNNDINQSGSPSTRALYSTAGGPGNAPYASAISGRQLGKTTLSISVTPVTIYALMKTRLNTDNTAYMDYNSNTGLRMVRSGGNRGNLRIYTGITPFYSFNYLLSPSYRNDWQLVKMTIKDDNSFWVETNNDPTSAVFYKDVAGGSTLAIDRLIFTNSDICQVRVFNKLVPDKTDRMLKSWYVDKFGLKDHESSMIAFGDSHTQGVANFCYIDTIQKITPWKIVNAGVSGTKITDGANSLSSLIPDFNKKEYSKYWLHFQYGTNDAVSPGYVWDTWKAEYKGYINQFIQNGFDPKKIIILTPPFSTGGYVSNNLDEVTSKIREIAKELNINLYDWYEETRSKGYDMNGNGGVGDAIHGNGDVHLLAANGVLRILEKSRLNSTPSYTTAQRDTLFAREGDVIYNKTTTKLQNYVAGAWADVSSVGGGGSPAGTTGSIQVNASGAFASNDSISILDEPARIGVGIFAPIASRLHIRGYGSTSATTGLIVQNLANTDILRTLDDGTVRVYASSSTSGGLEVQSTVAGNLGKLYIRPMASPVGSAPDFKIGSGAASRLFLDTYEVNIMNSGLLVCNSITSSGNISAGTTFVSGNSITFTSIANTNEKWIYYGNNGGGGEQKAGLAMVPTGAWANRDFAVVVTDAANLTPVTSSNAKFWVRASGDVQVINNLRIGSTAAATARLHMAAGIASSSGAPAKFTLAGHAQLATPEAGAFSPNTAGTSLLFTDVSAVNQRLLQIPESVTFSTSNGSKANVLYSGNGSTNSPGLNYYQNNIFSGTTDSNGDLQVTFAASMPDATFSILAQVEGTTLITCTAHTKSAGGVYLRCFNNTGTVLGSGVSVTVSYEARDY